MAGAQFEYDESGATAYYFFISFLAMIIIPMTYFLWPIGWRKGIFSTLICIGGHVINSFCRYESQRKNTGETYQ